MNDARRLLIAFLAAPRRAESRHIIASRRARFPDTSRRADLKLQYVISTMNHPWSTVRVGDMLIIV